MLFPDNQTSLTEYNWHWQEVSFVKTRHTEVLVFGDLWRLILVFFDFSNPEVRSRRICFFLVCWPSLGGPAYRHRTRNFVESGHEELHETTWCRSKELLRGTRRFNQDQEGWICEGLELNTGHEAVVSLFKSPTQNKSFLSIVGFVSPRLWRNPWYFSKTSWTGGRSIYGPSFADESFARLHARANILSMANSGPNTTRRLWHPLMST